MRRCDETTGRAASPSAEMRSGTSSVFHVVIRSVMDIPETMHSQESGHPDLEARRLNDSLNLQLLKIGVQYRWWYTCRTGAIRLAEEPIHCRSDSLSADSPDAAANDRHVMVRPEVRLSSAPGEPDTCAYEIGAGVQAGSGGLPELSPDDAAVPDGWL